MKQYRADNPAEYYKYSIDNKSNIGIYNLDMQFLESGLGKALKCRMEQVDYVIRCRHYQN